MKRRTRLISFLLVLAMILGLMPMPFGAGGQVLTVKAEDLPISGTCGDNSTWTLTEDTEVVDWDLQGTPYKLTIQGTGMISDVSDLYPYLDTITSISIEEGITGLGEDGFFSYPSLKSVTLPSSFTEIPKYAFAYDPLLQTIEFGNQLTKIGVQAFANCYSLESITFPDSLATIEGCAFQNCEALKSVTFSENLATIGERAFEDCGKLEELTFPDSLTTIGESAFEDCCNLRDVSWGKGLKVMGNGAFSNTGFSQIQFNEGLEEIGESAFEHCCNLFSVTLPDSLTTIKSKAFSMSALTDFTIPKNVSAIGEGIFYDCFYLKTIQVADGNVNFLAEDNILYEKGESGVPYQVKAYAIASPEAAVNIEDGTEIIDRSAFFRAKNITTVAFPDTLREIKEEAFFECKGLEELSIPDSVVSLGDRSFYGCSSINKVSVGAGLRDFGLRVFFGCNALEAIEVAEGNMHLDSVDNIIYDKGHTHLYYYMLTKGDQTYHIPDTVESISGYAIDGVSALKELYMPQNLNSIAGNAINANGSLSSIYFLSDAPGVVSGNSITGNASDLIIFRSPLSSGWDVSPWTSYKFADWEPENETVEEGNFGDIYWKYKADEGRLSFTGSGKLPDFTSDSPAPWSEYMGSIQTIGADSLSGIGDSSFCQAEKLIRVETNGGLKKVGSHAFAGCGSLCFLDISALEDIGSGAFEDNVSFGDIVLEKACSVGSGAFKGCTAITEVTFGISLTSLEKEVFAGCAALNNIVLPDSVAAIKDGAFKGCASLRTINIPAVVAEIGNAAFSEDARLEKVYFYGGLPEQWGDDSFTGCSDSLTIYYRKPQTAWEQLGGVWNGIPVQGQDKFYTERRDHYSFVNDSWSFGYEPGYQIPRQRYVDVMKSIATGTYHYVTKGKWDGSCYGMTSTTLEFYENPDYKVEDYDTSAQSLYDIAAPGEKNTPLTKLIEAYQISQYVPGIAACRGCVPKNMYDYKGLIRKVEEFERSGGLGIDSQAEPVIMVIFAAYSGHAVIPVSVDRDSAGDYVMKVYDPNNPGQLNTLKINRNLSGISYGMYTYASYVPYSLAANAMAGVQLYSDTKDDSLYLSIDKEKGRVTDAQGKGLEDIEGAYEQKSFNGTEEDVFPGIKSFVLPQGNYQLTAKNETEAGEETVAFYLATEDNFVKIISSDEDAVLDVQEDNTQGDGLEVGLQSDSQEKETASFTIMNDLGMQRTVEVEGGNATVKVAEDDTITIEAFDGEKVSIDGKEIEINNGQAVSSFVAAPGENPLRVEEIETSVNCGADNKLNGTVSATVVLNAVSAKKATITTDYYEAGSGKKAATYSQEVQMDAGMNMESISFENVDTDFSEAEGPVPMICKLTVLDEDGNSIDGTVEGITVTLTKKTDPTNPTDPTDPEVAVENVMVMPEELTLLVGESAQLNATVLPEDATDKKLVYTALNDNVSVTQDGKVTANKVGTSQIKISSANGKNAVVSITVKEKTGSGDPGKPGGTEVAVTGIRVESAQGIIGVGESFRLKVSVLPSNATDKALTFTASNGNVTVTPQGVVTAQKAGSSRITVKSSNGKYAVANIIVRNAPSKITLNAKNKTLKVGKTFQIKAKLPKNTASSRISYSSSNKSVAAVSLSGKVTARKKGTAVITVKTYNGKYAKLKITVKKDIPVKKITVKKKKLVLKAGQTVRLKVSIQPKNATDKRVSYKASNKKVKVSKKGYVTAKKAGKSKITIKSTNGKKVVVNVTVKKN